MLTITVPPTEWWDSEKEEFLTRPGKVLQMEHSLVSVSKWESKWRKPFFSNKKKTAEEWLDYFRCMTVTQNVDESVYQSLGAENIERIRAYIEEPMTATFFSGNKKENHRSEQITSELIYYWMISCGISKEFEKWNINRLFTLIRIFGEKNKPSKKRSSRELGKHYQALNAARRRKYGTRG